MKKKKLRFLVESELFVDLDYLFERLMLTRRGNKFMGAQ